VITIDDVDGVGPSRKPNVGRDLDLLRDST
jgi:hypothetical protein